MLRRLKKEKRHLEARSSDVLSHKEEKKIAAAAEN